MKDILQKTRQSLVSSFLLLDAKITNLIPNPKTKRILYIAVGSLFGFMLLIIIIGVLLSPFRKNGETTTVLNKPNIINTSPESQRELSANQKLILDYEKKIKLMQFPESILNIPVIEKGLSI